VNANFILQTDIQVSVSFCKLVL